MFIDKIGKKKEHEDNCQNDGTDEKKTGISEIAGYFFKTGGIFRGLEYHKSQHKEIEAQH